MEGDAITVLISSLVYLQEYTMKWLPRKTSMTSLNNITRHRVGEGGDEKKEGGGGGGSLYTRTYLHLQMF